MGEIGSKVLNQNQNRYWGVPRNENSIPCPPTQLQYHSMKTGSPFWLPSNWKDVSDRLRGPSQNQYFLCKHLGQNTLLIPYRSYGVQGDLSRVI